MLGELVNLMIINNDILLVGKHAEYVKALVSNGYLIESDAKFSLYKRYIDVFMNGAIIGLIYNSKEEIDSSSKYKESRASILLAALIGEKNNLDYIFRLAMLLDDENMSEEDRLTRAFRDDSLADKTDNHKKNMEVFMSYVRGGITILYNRITETASSAEDYYENIMNFMGEFDFDNANRGDVDSLLDRL